MEANRFTTILWGTGIVIAFVAFIAFIMYFVINMNLNKKYVHDLVTEDYYQEELLHQNEIDKVDNAKDLKENVSWKKTDDGILISFPKDLDYKNITGKVFLYRPSDKKLDSEISISLSNSDMLIPINLVLTGRRNEKLKKL